MRLIVATVLGLVCLLGPSQARPAPFPSLIISPRVIPSQACTMRSLSEGTLNAKAITPSLLQTCPPTFPRTITVTWSGVHAPHPHDQVHGVVDLADGLHHQPIVVVSCNESARWEEGYGSVSVQMPNIRAPVRFELVRAGKIMLRSDMVVPESTTEPTQGHLSLTDDPSQMRVMWVSGPVATPQVHYWHSGAHFVVNATSTTYTINQMCGAPANDSTYWIDPGFIHTATLNGLPNDATVNYTFGSASGGWSPVTAFHVGTKSGSTYPFNFIAYGDLGVSPEQAPAINSTRTVIRELSDTDLVLHIGDISYARGHAILWERFFDAIEPIATTVPYMVCIGNHEFDWPSVGWHPWWGTYNTDSGGECGVPYETRFNMPGGDGTTNNLWYSFDKGPVHFTLMSTEHNFTDGSPQVEWLRNDLASVDRTKTPWVVFSGHRPIYDSSISELLPEEFVLRSVLEPLFQEYKVDLALWGHVHQYQRTCPVTNEKCQPDGEAPVNMVIGNAGNTYQVAWLGAPEWIKYRSKDYGITKYNVVNETHMEVRFFADESGAVQDHFWIIR